MDDPLRTKEELIHILGIRLAIALESKRGGLPTYFNTEYCETDTVLTGGDFERRFGTSLTRFQKVMHFFKLAESPTSITSSTVSFIRLFIYSPTMLA